MKLAYIASCCALASLAVVSSCASHSRSHDRSSEHASVVLVEHAESNTRSGRLAWIELLKTVRTPAGSTLDNNTIAALEEVLDEELKRRALRDGGEQKMAFIPVLVPIIAAVASTLVGVAAQQAGQAIQKEGEDYAASWSAKAYRMDYWTTVDGADKVQLAPRYESFAVVRSTKKGNSSERTPSFILLCAMTPAKDRATFEVAPLMLYAPNSKAKLSTKGKVQLDIGFELAAWWEDSTGNPKHATIGSSEVPLRIAYDVERAPLVLWTSKAPEQDGSSGSALEYRAKKDGVAVERRSPVTLAIAHHCPPSMEALSSITESLRESQFTKAKEFIDKQLEWIREQLIAVKDPETPRWRFLKELEDKLGRDLVRTEAILAGLKREAPTPLEDIGNLGGTFRIAVEVRETDESKRHQHLLLIGRSIESSSSALKDATAKGIGNIPTE